MKKMYFVAAMAVVALPAVAQETYQDTKLVENELNGTARYVGMGGAMEALGADLSTMGTNPAGIGLFRSSQVAVSGGLVSQQDETTNPVFKGQELLFKGNKTNASFDQIGLVYAMRTGYNNFLNFGFNYHKSRNFDQILTAGNSLDKASQNKLTAVKYPYGSDYNWNGVDGLYQEALGEWTGNKLTGMHYYNGTQFLFGQYQKGYIGEYDFNVSGNINDRVFLGLTFGIHDVHYRSNSLYAELLDVTSTNGTQQSLPNNSYEDLHITGTGYDVKLGAIFRPIETSPFRIGVYVNTPVWYDLHSQGTVSMPNLAQFNSNVSKLDNYADYDFKVYTPWKFGVSLGHTIDKMVALGATYEYADYSHIDNRVNDGGYNSWYDDYDDSYSDEAMNNNTKSVLKSVSTLKLGAEVKVLPQMAVRVGYNYVSPMFDKNGFRDGSIESQGSIYATSTDYTNWKCTNRWTFGLGYVGSKFYADMAYQYTQTNGQFFPFMSYVSSDTPSQDNVADKTNVSFKRNQLVFTVGYKF